MTIPIRASEATLIEVRQALQRIEANRRTGILHNFDDDDTNSAPVGTDDESQGYQPGSFWFDKSADKLYINTDATVGNAQWADMFSDVLGTGHNYGTVEPEGGVTLEAGTKGDTLTVNGTGGCAITGTSDPDILIIDAAGSAIADPQYIVMANTGDLANERKLAAGNGLTLTDLGAGSTVSVNAVATSVGGLLANADDIQLDISTLGTATIAATDTLAFDSGAGVNKKTAFSAIDDLYVRVDGTNPLTVDWIAAAETTNILITAPTFLADIDTLDATQYLFEATDDADIWFRVGKTGGFSVAELGHDATFTTILGSSITQTATNTIQFSAGSTQSYGLSSDKSSGTPISFVTSSSAIGLTATTGHQNFLQILPRIQQGGDASYTGLLVNVFDDSTGTGSHLLMDLQLDSSTLCSVDDEGELVTTKLGVVTEDAASLNDVLKWNGTNWVPGTAGDTSEFTFSIASFSDGIGSGNILMGAGGNYADAEGITFTATYNNEPGGMVADITISGDATWSTNPMTMAATNTDNNIEAVTWPTGSYPWSITFTLGTDADATEDSETLTFTNAIYWGDTATASSYVSGDVTGLTGSITNNDHTRTGMSVTGVGASDYILFACPARLSNLSSVNFTYNALVIAMEAAETVSVTNASGYVENFEVYRSTSQNLGDGTLTSNQSTAQNRMYWGHVASSSGITEGQVEGLSGGSSTISNSMSSRSMTITGATGSDYTVIAYPARLTALTSIIIGGFESIADFNVDATDLEVTNINGYLEEYRVYVSQNPGFTDPTTMTVTI